MRTAKQDALQTISQMPDTARMDEIMYRLYVLDKVRRLGGTMWSRAA